MTNDETERPPGAMRLVEIGGRLLDDPQFVELLDTRIVDAPLSEDGLFHEIQIDLVAEFAYPVEAEHVYSLSGTIGFEW